MNFKDLKEETIGLANQTFAETFEKVFRGHWQTGFMHNIAKNYNVSDIRNGVYQALIPTMPTPDYTMNYSSIIINVVPSINQEQAKEIAKKLHNQSVRPCGYIDSELIVFVSLQRSGWTHGFKHVSSDKGGYLTSIFVAGDKGITSTNELWRKLMQKVIIPFYEKRLFKFLECYNLTQTEDYRSVTLTQLYYKGGSIIERLDMLQGLFVKSLSHFINWLHTKQNWFVEQFKAVQITRQAEKKALEHCKPIPLKLRMQSKRQLIAKLQASLEADVKMAELLKNRRDICEKDLAPRDSLGLDFEERRVLLAVTRGRYG